MLTDYTDVCQALYASKLISYTQGFMLMRETAKQVGKKVSRNFVETYSDGS